MRRKHKKQIRKAFSDYEQPAAAVDLAIMTVLDGALQVLMMRRPDAEEVGGDWALPGGFVQVDISLERTVTNVLATKARLRNIYLEQVGAFGALKRDPRGRVISIAYFALTPPTALDAALEAADDLELMCVEVPWEGETGGPVRLKRPNGRRAKPAFDHAHIIGQVVKRLRGKLDYSTVGLELLPERFTLREAQEIHEAILGRKLNKPPFRRKLLDRGIVVATGEYETGSAFRPAELYQQKKT